MTHRQKPILSICVPTYKKADWLELSLRITLEQAKYFIGKIEVVVSDDASPDHSGKVLEKLQKEYPDLLRIFIQSQNLKNNKNYLFTIQQAHGEYIWLLGNDDYLREGAIERVLGTLEAHKNIDFMYMSYSFFNPPDSPQKVMDELKKEIKSSDLPPCSLGGHVFEDRPLKWLGEVPIYDALCFTPMYAAIVRKPLWKACFQFNADGEFFRHLQGSFGYAEHLVRHFLNRPGYYIGYPFVMASRDISWGSFAASACLKNMPVLYDLLEQKGVSRKALRFIRTDYLKLIRDSIPYVLQYRTIFHHDEFSFWSHTREFWTYPQYWKNLLTIIPKQINYMRTKGFWVPFLKGLLKEATYNKLKNIFKSTRSPFQTILGLKFFRKSCDELIQNMPKKCLITAPAAPALLNLRKDVHYQKALQAADFNLVDSGLMALCWNLTHPTKRIEKTSGYKFLKSFIESPIAQGKGKTFWVMANEKDLSLGIKWLNCEPMPQGMRFAPPIHQPLAVKAEDFYIAPQYHKGAIEDINLLNTINQKRPAFVILNIGGGTQERLGDYLKKNLNYEPLILCTGAALGFLTGHQTPIPMWADRFYLGWLWRCMGNPKTFIPRYINGLKFIPLFLKFHEKSPSSALN